MSLVALGLLLLCIVCQWRRSNRPSEAVQVSQGADLCYTCAFAAEQLERDLIIKYNIFNNTVFPSSWICIHRPNQECGPGFRKVGGNCATCCLLQRQNMPKCVACGAGQYKTGQNSYKECTKKTKRFCGASWRACILYSPKVGGHAFFIVLKLEGMHCL